MPLLGKVRLVVLHVKVCCNWSDRDSSLSSLSHEAYVTGGAAAEELTLQLQDMKADVKVAKESLKPERARVRTAESAARDADMRACKAQAQGATDDITRKQLNS